MHFEHLAIMEKKFDPINLSGRIRTLRLHNGRGNPGAPTKAIIGSGTNYGSRPTPRIMSVNLLSFLSGSKMASTFKLTMHGS
jgi:hypothetical protein